MWSKWRLNSLTFLACSEEFVTDGACLQPPESGNGSKEFGNKSLIPGL